MNVSDGKFIAEIQDLINSHREGTYWDFKREWYSKGKSGDMLHDIICMANNVENRDAYIIIGVDDEFNICGVDKDDYRKTTQNITDFLRDKHFAGDFRPVIEVKTIEISEHMIDVICIKNNEYVPYYLTHKEKNELLPYHIYTRVQDSNTPKDKSADLIHVEMLWKKRFHLLDSPLQKMKYFLTQKNIWSEIVSEENSTLRYYNYSPEYTIKIIYIEGDAVETYILTQMDKNGSWYSIQLYYHQTLLFSTNGVLLDGGRFLTVQPTIGSLNFWGSTIFYYYLCTDTIKFKLYEFFIHDEDSRDYLANKNYTDEILFFNGDDERKAFESYFYQHLGDYGEFVKSVKNDSHRKLISQMQDEYDYRLALKKFQQSYCAELQNMYMVEC